MYDPQNAQEATMIKHQISSAFREALESGNEQIAMEASRIARGASFCVSLVFRFGPNDSDSKATKNAKLWGLTPHISKPDLDNLEKFYLDCSTGIIWDDDAQITFCSSAKMYDENPRTEMEIMIKPEMKLEKEAQSVIDVLTPSQYRLLLEDCNHLCQEGTPNALVNFATKWAELLRKIKKDIEKQD